MTVDENKVKQKHVNKKSGVLCAVRYRNKSMEACFSHSVGNYVKKWVLFWMYVVFGDHLALSSLSTGPYHSK